MASLLDDMRTKVPDESVGCAAAPLLPGTFGCKIVQTSVAGSSPRPVTRGESIDQGSTITTFSKFNNDCQTK